MKNSSGLTLIDEQKFCSTVVKLQVINSDTKTQSNGRMLLLQQSSLVVASSVLKVLDKPRFKTSFKMEYNRLLEHWFFSLTYLQMLMVLGFMDHNFNILPKASQKLWVLESVHF